MRQFHALVRRMGAGLSLLLLWLTAVPQASAGCLIQNEAPATIQLGETAGMSSQLEIAAGVTVNGSGNFSALQIRFEVIEGSAELNGSMGSTLVGVPFSGTTPATISGSVSVKPLTAGLLRIQATWLGGTGGTSPLTCDGLTVDSNGLSKLIQVNAATASATLAIASGNNQTVREGSDSAPLVVEARDATGAAVVGAQVNFIATPAGRATLSASSAATDSNGRAQVRLRGVSAGAIQVQAGLAAAPTSTVNFNALITPRLQGARLTAITTGLQTVAVGAFSNPLVVELKDADGTAISGSRIQWRTEPAQAGSFECADCTTDSSGRAQNRVKPLQSGAFSAVAFVADAPDLSARFSIVAGGVPAGSTLTVISGNNQQLVPGAPSAPLVVELKSAQGQALSGVAIRFSGAPTGAVNFLPNAVVLTDAAGRATVNAAPQLPVPITITAAVVSDPNISVSFSLTGGTRFLGGLNGNQQQIAGLIDTVCPQLAGMPPAMLGDDPTDLLARCSELVGAINGRPDDAREALNQLLPDEAAPQATASLNVRDSQLRNLDLRLETLRAGGRAASGLNLSGLSLQTGSGSLPIALLKDLAQELSGAEDADETAGGLVSPWGVFVTGTVGRVDRDSTIGNPGFNANTFSVTGGVDYRFSQRLVAGAAVGFDTNDIDVVNGAGNVEVRSLTLSLYSSYSTDSDFYLDGRLSAGMLDFDLERRIRFQLGPNPVDVVARAQPEGDSRLLALSAGKNWAWNAWNLGGYLRGEWSRIDLDGYAEQIRNPSGAGRGLATAVEDRSLDSRTATLGLRFSYASSRDWGVLLPYGRVEWVKEFEDDPQLIRTRFVNDPNRNGITIVTDGQDDGYGNAAIGFTGVFSDGRSAFLQYERRFAQENIERSTLTLGGRFEF